MFSEKAAIIKIKNGNTRAYKKLYDLYFIRLYRFLSRFTNDQDELEDWCQTAFIKAYENIGSFGFNSKFSTWLFSIAINEMRSYLRTKNRRAAYHEPPGDYDPGYEESPDFIWQHDMHIYLSQLSEENKAVFILFEVEGYSHKEISEILNISESACRSKLFRTKQFLKESWSKNEKE